MSLPVKAGIGLLTAGSVVGLGYAGSTYFKGNEEKVSTIEQKTEISKLIKDQFEYILLNTTENNDSSYWDINWRKYNSENTASEAGKDPFQLTGWTKGNSKDLTAELKKKCNTLSTSKIANESDALYSKVTSYCGRRVTVADAIGKLELEVLDTTESNGKHTTIWDKRVREKATLQKEFTALKISDSNADKSAVKNACNTAKAKSKNDVNDYQSTLDAYKKVCTKQKDDPS